MRMYPEFKECLPPDKRKNYTDELARSNRYAHLGRGRGNRCLPIKLSRLVDPIAADDGFKFKPVWLIFWVFF